MDWRKAIYGTSEPSLGRHILLIAVLFWGYGVWTEFVPSAFGAKGGVFLSSVTTVPLTIYLWRGYSTGTIPWGRRPNSFIFRLLSLAALPFLIFNLIWVITVRAIPDVAARVVGTQTSVTMTLKASCRPRRRECDCQLESEQLRFPWHICFSPSEFGPFSPVEAVILSGPATRFGIHVSHIEPVRGNDP